MSSRLTVRVKATSRPPESARGWIDETGEGNEGGDCQRRCYQDNGKHTNPVQNVSIYAIHSALASVMLHYGVSHAGTFAGLRK